MLTNPQDILAALARHPSRASAAAIGQSFVLNGVSGRWQVRGLDTLSDMVCDWTVAVLDDAIHDASREFQTRLHALAVLSSLMRKAIRRGYRQMKPRACRRLTHQARHELDRRRFRADNTPIPAVEDLCGHLGQAIADGLFSPLPDF